MPAARAVEVWDALDRRRPPVRHQAGRHARARRRADRSRAAADRRRFLQQPQGDDRVAEVLALRARAWAGWSASTRGASSASARCARSTRADPPRQIVGLEIDWNEVEKLYDAVGPRARRRRDRLARRGAGLPQRPPGRQGDVHDLVAGAEADDRAGHRRSAALRRGHRSAVRDDGRGRPPPRPREGGEDAVLQPAAEDSHTAVARLATRHDVQSTLHRAVPSCAGSP